MIKRSYKATLHIKSNEDAVDVSLLAGKVYAGLLANVAIYKTPDPTLVILKTDLDKLDSSIKNKDGSSQKLQVCKDLSRVVYGHLKNLAAYVDKISNGDKAMILLSGFDSNSDAETHDIPDKPSIGRIEDGKVPCSAKIFMSAVPDADRYKVEVSYTPTDAASWKTLLDPVSISKMELKNLTRAKDVYIRVTAGNTHGWGIPSEPVVFLPR